MVVSWCLSTIFSMSFFLIRIFLVQYSSDECKLAHLHCNGIKPNLEYLGYHWLIKFWDEKLIVSGIEWWSIYSNLLHYSLGPSNKFLRLGDVFVTFGYGCELWHYC